MCVLKVKVISLLYIFQVLYVLCLTRPRYQMSFYRTIGPLVFIPPQTVFVGGYTVFTLSVRPNERTNERKCVRDVLFPKYLEESLIEFYQTLQKHSYVQGKYYLYKIKG